jgi:ribosomal-protein-alanine N-acetyltransferase
VDVTIRPPVPADAGQLARLHRANRAFLAPYDPIKPEDFFSEAGQLARVTQALADCAAGLRYPFVIVADGELAGQVNLNNVVRHAWQNTNLGYWVSEHLGGRGVASLAVSLVCRFAFDDARLHRVEAGTLADNVRSQRVLEKNGFLRIGVAPRYLKIAGRWQDHVLFQRVVD